MQAALSCGSLGVISRVHTAACGDAQTQGAHLLAATPQERRQAHPRLGAAAPAYDMAR
jgi:hypothetical protein